MLYLCYSINDFAIMEAGISLLSFLMNNPGYEPEEVFFVDYGIHPRNKERLGEIAARYGKRVTFLDGKSVTDEVKREFPHLGAWRYTMAPNAKPFMDKIVPDYVERLLFVDADTLVTGSVRELQSLDMGGAALAAVPQGYDTASIRSGGLTLCHGSDMYFNSGVLLYDLAVWRREDCHGMVRETLTMKRQFYSPDQTLLNNAMPARLLYRLPLKYNHLTHHMHPRQEPKYLASFGVYTKEEISEAIQHPVITHFTGGDHQARPWHEGCWSYRKDEYLRYKALSPWKDTPQLYDYRKKHPRKGFFGKGTMFVLWLMAKQPSYRLTAFVSRSLGRLSALRARVMNLPPGMEEGIEER